LKIQLSNQDLSVKDFRKWISKIDYLLDIDILLNYQLLVTYY